MLQGTKSDYPNRYCGLPKLLAPRGSYTCKPQTRMFTLLCCMLQLLPQRGGMPENGDLRFPLYELSKILGRPDDSAGLYKEIRDFLIRIATTSAVTECLLLRGRAATDCGHFEYLKRTFRRGLSRILQHGNIVARREEPQLRTTTRFTSFVAFSSWESGPARSSPRSAARATAEPLRAFANRSWV
jgi:hypothetical protein